MLNFNFLEQGLGIVSQKYFVNDCSNKIFLMFYSRVIPWKIGHEGLKKIFVIPLIFIYIIPYSHL